MTNKADLEKIYFHNYNKHSRINNPTFVSNFVNDSLSLFTPNKPEVKQIVKKSQYKSNFETLKENMNTGLPAPQQPHNYAKYSKQAFEKSRSYLSQYGSNLISPNITKKGP